MYRLDVQSPDGTSTFTVHAVTLASAERTALAEGLRLSLDLNATCSMVMRVAHSPELLRRCDNPGSPWYWCSCGRRLPAAWVPGPATRAAWGAL